MRMHGLVLAAGLVAAFAGPAMAQEPPAGMRQGGPGGNPMAMLMQGITLTAEQQAKVDSVTRKYTDMLAALRQDQSMDRETRMSKMRELRPKQFEDVKAILTDDQKKVFDKNLADMQAQMPQRRPPAA